MLKGFYVVPSGIWDGVYKKERKQDQDGLYAWKLKLKTEEYCYNAGPPYILYCVIHDCSSFFYSQDCPIFYMRKKAQKDLTEQDKTIKRFTAPPPPTDW